MDISPADVTLTLTEINRRLALGQGVYDAIAKADPAAANRLGQGNLLLLELASIHEKVVKKRIAREIQLQAANDILKEATNEGSNAKTPRWDYRRNFFVAPAVGETPGNLPATAKTPKWDYRMNLVEPAKVSGEAPAQRAPVSIDSEDVAGIARNPGGTSTGMYELADRYTTGDPSQGSSRVPPGFQRPQIKWDYSSNQFVDELSAEPAKADDGSVTLTFQPGQIGIILVYKQREVEQVAPGSQAYNLGVEGGWIVTDVEGVSCETGDEVMENVKSQLGACRASGRGFRMTFQKPAQQ